MLFYAFSGIAILGAGLMLAQHNPVRAALSFALVVLSTCGLFLLLSAPFLMAATIIIYAGAIIITFLFVIMLAQQIGMTSADQRSREPFLASLAGFVLLACLLVVLKGNYDVNNYDVARIDERITPVKEKLERAIKAEKLEEIKKALENPDKHEDGPTLELITELQVLLPKHDVMNIEQKYHNGTRKELHDLCAKYLELLDEQLEQVKQSRHGAGSLQPKLPLSTFSGRPARLRFRRRQKSCCRPRTWRLLGSRCSPSTWWRCRSPACCCWWRPSGPSSSSPGRKWAWRKGRCCDDAA